MGRELNFLEENMGDGDSSSFPSSSGMISGSAHSFKLRVLKHQQQHAAIILQRYGRGYLTRKRLWSYGGVFFTFCVLRIQCAWRQYLALQTVKNLWRRKVERSIHRILSLFYYWKSRRIRKIIKLTYLKNIITKFQANVRRKLMRKKYLVLLFIHKTKNATTVQSILRMFKGKLISSRRKNSIKDILHSFSSYTLLMAVEQVRNDISFLISSKILEISSSIPKLQQSFLQFSYSIIYDISINNQFMNSLVKVQYLNLLFNKLQYNLLTYMKTNKNNVNKLFHQSSSSSSPSSLLNQILNYHQIQFIVQFINYLIRMNLWTKYNKTRQIHFTLLEQSLGILSCQYSLMNYNYPGALSSDEAHLSTINPYSLSSLLLFPRQLLNSRQPISTAHSNSSLSVSTISPRSVSSDSIESPRSRKNMNHEMPSPQPSLYRAPPSSFLLRKAASGSFTLRGSQPVPSLQPILTLAANSTDQSNWQLQGYQLNEILQTIYLISSWHSTSLVKLFDAIMFKVDLLFFMLSFPDVFDSINEKTKQILNHSFSTILDFSKDDRDISITNEHLYRSSTLNIEDTSLAVHHGLPFYRINVTRTALSTAENASLPIEEPVADINKIQDIKQFRELQKKRKEKKVIKKIKQKAKSERHRVMHRIWKMLDQAREIVVPGSLDSYELSYRMDLFNSLLQTVHDGYVIRDMLKEFIIVLDAQGNSILPDQERSQHHQQKMHQLKNQSQGISFSVQIHLKIIISGTIVFVTGAIPAPQTSQQSSSSENAQKEVQDSTRSKKLNNSSNLRHVQNYIYDKIPLFPWPIHPMLLFPHEVNQLANHHKIFSIQQYSISGQNETTANKKQRISRRLSSNQWLDYEKFVDYLLSEISLVFSNSQATMAMNTTNSTNFTTPNVTIHQTFISPDSEPLMSFYLPEIHFKRKLLLDSNIMKYSVIIIQRIFRGYLGRNKFKLIYHNYLVMKRKRYLSYKVFYRLKVMYYNHQQAAIQIQRIMRGYLLRKQIRRWHYYMLKIQCAIRIYYAKKRVAEEKKRLFDGPQVILVNRGGKMIEIQSQLLQLFIYRCHNHYKFLALNALANRNYSGYIYEKELKNILLQYNADVITSLNGDRDSLYSKQTQVQVWQYEKLINFFYKYLNLLPKVINITTQFLNERKEEKDYYLAICYQRGSAMIGGPSSVFQHPNYKAPAVTDLNSEELQQLWKHNYGNIYRSNLLETVSSITETKPSTETNRLQKAIPKDFTEHPIIETVKKFQLFKEFNNTKKPRRNSLNQNALIGKSPKLAK